MSSVTITLSIPEAVKLVSCCNASYVMSEQSLANTSPTNTTRREMLRNSMTTAQNLKAKIKEAIINGME